MATNTNSNTYTILYATVMVVIVAFLLSLVASSLKERQDANEVIYVQKQILRAVNVESEDTQKEFAENVKDYLYKDNDLVEVPASEFKTSYASEIKEGNFHVFVYEKNGEKKYIFPLAGAGLWGPIRGYISVNDDKNTVYGVDFSHDSETPGLGAEITADIFKSQFAGKKVVKDAKVALTVVKNGTVQDNEVECDGISGGTLTSNGVKDMLMQCLSNYQSFLAAPAVCATDSVAAEESEVAEVASEVASAEASAPQGGALSIQVVEVEE